MCSLTYITQRKNGYTFFNQCPSAFGTEEGLKTHQRTHSLVTCETCGESINLNQMPNHKLRHNPEKRKLFQCSFCPKVFNLRKSLVCHENAHKGLKPYACDQCGVSFADRGNLNNHKKSVHRGIKRKQKR